MTFLSLLDDRAKPKGSRDPLGFELVWSYFGRKVVGNLTTITSSMDNFAVALLGFYWVSKLVRDNPDTSERNRQLREMFLRYEQLSGYVRYYAGSADIMGISRVKIRVLDPSVDISLGLSPDQQILSDQASYGLWGLYSSAARDTGLVKGNDRECTCKGISIVQLILAQLGEGENDWLQRLKAGNHLHREELKEMAGPFMRAIRHKTVQEPLLSALMTGNAQQGIQSELWKTTLDLFERNQRLPEKVAEYVPLVLAQQPSEALVEHLNDIVAIERLLVATNNLFNYCRRKDGCDLSMILETLESRYAYDHLPDQLPSGDFPRRQALSSVLSAFKRQDNPTLVREILGLNKDVMKDRSGAAWVEIEGGKTLRVRVKSEKAELVDQATIRERWDYDYFLGSFLRIAQHHFRGV